MAEDLNTKSATAMTRDAAAAIQTVFEDLGGVPRLTEWCNASPGNLSAFYTTIWPKIVPKNVKAEVDGTISIEVVRFGAPTPIEGRVIASHALASSEFTEDDDAETDGD